MLDVSLGVLLACGCLGRDETAGDYANGNPSGLPYPFETRNGGWGFFNRQGVIVVPPSYEIADVFHDGMALVVVRPPGDQQPTGAEDPYLRRYGFVDMRGRLVVKPEFEGACPFSGGFACVKVGTKYGFIDKTGKLVIEPRFDGGGAFSCGVCIIPLGGQECVIDRTGRVLHSSPPGESWETALFSTHRDGLMKFRQAGKWGFLDTQGKVAIPCQYDEVGDFGDGYCVVGREDRVFLIDRKGGEAKALTDTLARLEIVGPPTGFGAFGLRSGSIAPGSHSFSEGLLGCGNTKEFFFIDTEGRVVLRLDLAKFVCGGWWGFKDGLCVVGVHPPLKPGFEATRGGLGSPAPKSPESLPPDIGLFGVIDRTGRFVVEPVYETIEEHRQSVGFIVRKDGKLGILDKRGQLTVQPKFKCASFCGDLVLAIPESGETLWLDPEDGRTIFSVK